MSARFQSPSNSLGADLVWWRESASLHTMVTIYGVIEELNAIAPGNLPEIHLELALFSPEGEFRHSWREPLPRDGIVVIDSAKFTGILSEGLLAIFACTQAKVPELVQKKYKRLFSMVDWYSDEREISSLHNDQSLCPCIWDLDFTEIVVTETATQRNSLVILNGPEAQQSASIRLSVQNRNREMREAVYKPTMPPFTVHRLFLSELFPDLVGFSNGEAVLLSGCFQCTGIYVRPYVITEGKTFNAYHGGDRYESPSIPGMVYKYLGRGEVNPMVAVHRKGLTTSVNILNSHGDLADDFWIDARLWDEAGNLVAQRERWLLAGRNQLSRGEIADLLPDWSAPFTGHVALNFSADAKSLYPRRLQALLEYRTPVSVARVMAWSDVWNGRHKLRELNDKIGKALPVEKLFSSSYLGADKVSYHCHYRMWFKPPLISHIAITNCGIEADYRERAPYVLKLRNRRGEILKYEGDLAPQATDYGRIDKFFPEVSIFAASDSISMATIDSPMDLAVMHLTEHQTSGAFSAEHFIASGSYHDGRYYWICGW